MSVPKKNTFPSAGQPCSVELVLQGGGALGAYQMGVYEQLHASGYLPQWVAGVSIGAINAAIIVGNPVNRRIKRLHDFWDLVSSRLSNVPVVQQDHARATFNQLSALMAALAGVPGFYKPRLPLPILQLDGTAAAMSFYDTAPLKQTLEQLIDFDLINSKTVRLSIGAVNVRTGNSEYFDNFSRRITADHILASGALPPAFAPVVIEGESYWDGGIVSNTPLQYVLDKRDGKRRLIFQVDLFSARGPMPQNIGEVMQRHKDIQYSSRTRYNTDMVAALSNTREAIRQLLTKLPAALQKDPNVKHLAEITHAEPVDIVHLIYRHKRYELESKDYEFSRASVIEHWQSGQRDTRDTLDHPECLKKSGIDAGVSVYDLNRDCVDSKTGASTTQNGASDATFDGNQTRHARGTVQPISAVKQSESLSRDVKAALNASTVKSKKAASVEVARPTTKRASAVKKKAAVKS